MKVQDETILETTKLRTRRMESGALWRVSLDSPKGNVIDERMTSELSDVFQAAAREPRLKAIVLSAEGPNFSFGASVEQHQKDQVATMLADFHGLFRTIAAAGVPVIAAVRGGCFGGGLELAAFCQRIFVHPEAKLGQPEIALGVFAPVASIILENRVGQGGADDLLLTGRVVEAEEAKAMGLVDEIAPEPEARAQDWVLEHLAGRSASSLRFATRAARCNFMRRFERGIVELERMYLDELMQTNDANEGIASFLEKRKPNWSDS